MTRLVAIGAFVLAAVAIGGMALADSHETIHACVQDSTGNIKIVEGDECPPRWSLTSWNQVGPMGPQGPIGPEGPGGPEGPQGEPGLLGTYVVETEVDIAGGGFAFGSASCSYPDVATGGGFLGGGNAIRVTQNQPAIRSTGEAGGWAVGAKSLVADDWVFFVYAICADVS